MTVPSIASHPSAATSRWDRRVLLTFYWGAVATTCVVAVIVTLVVTPGSPAPACAAGRLCPGPPPQPTSRFTTWTDRSLAVRFQYPSALFSVIASSGGSIQLRFRGAQNDAGRIDATAWVTAVSTHDASAAGLLRLRQAQLTPSIIGLTFDDSSSTVLPALQIGQISATGGSYRGSIDTAQGPVRPAYVTLATASNGRASVVISYVIAGTSDPTQVRLLRSYLSPVFSTFSWDA